MGIVRKRTTNTVLTATTTTHYKCRHCGYTDSKKTHRLTTRKHNPYELDDQYRDMVSIVQGDD
jgi:hypothetical protein